MSSNVSPSPSGGASIPIRNARTGEMFALQFDDATGAWEIYFGIDPTTGRPQLLCWGRSGPNGIPVRVSPPLPGRTLSFAYELGLLAGLSSRSLTQGDRQEIASRLDGYSNDRAIFAREP